jgi:hypothetical protein
MLMAIKKKKIYAVDPMSGTAPSIGYITKKVSEKVSEVKHESSGRQSSNKKAHKSLSFEFSIPTLTLPKLRYKKKIVLFTILGLVIAISGLIYGIYNINQSSNVEVSETKPVQTAPTFDTLGLTKGQKTEKIVAYDEEKKVASYSDVIDGTEVTVSQQPLPDNFKTNSTKEVEKLAASFKATNAITAGKVTAYSGVASETGTQTIVFTKNQLLIFILASKELTGKSIAKYITDLK